ncbi:hypothetical protein EMA8858_02665 [Emticicia aquatica]|uniref:DUF2490 domain-containing protein n=1 Tax=Emticicia aquatica TaxID=1681835 RepID=A0ABM9ASA2_9BACT|nr:DUF2490 domain-containing protein [Emticicia aquatica]CAH0996533.1 hypothetical protein EMA8858_02665 [Emticicia aquatica]
MKIDQQFSKIDKHIKHTFVLGIVLFLSILSGHAQSYNHTSVWSRLLLSKQIDKFSFSGDIAYRRQNDFHFSKINFLNKPLLDAQRLTVGYRNKNWLFSFAASRWHAYQILGKEADFQRKPTIEWRFTPGVEYFKKIRKGTLQWRTQYEYRSFVDRSAGRFRQRFQYRMPISDSNNLVFLQEFLFGAPPNSTKKYEQNQLGLTFNHFFTKQLESEIGYRYIYRKRRTSDEIDNENTLVIGLMLRL